MRTVFCLPLLVVMGTTSVVPARADEPTPPAADQSVSKETIAALIRGLADPSTAQRDAAAKRLIEIGAPAKAQLEAASKSDRELDVIRRRARVLLLSITRREKVDRWNAFVSGKTDDGPPGWKKFRKIVGGTPDARKLFVDMYRAQPQLMQAYSSDFIKAQGLLNALLETQYGKKEKEPAYLEAKQQSIGCTAAILFVAGDKRIADDEHATQTEKILALLGLDVYWEAALLTGASAASANDSDRTKNKSLCKLIVHWMRLPDGPLDLKDDHNELMLKLMVSMRYEVVGLIPYAARLISDERTPSSVQDMAVLVIGQLGDENHTKLLEPLLGDNRKVTSHLILGEKRLLLCDLALGTLVEMSGQKLTDFHFTTPQGLAKKATFFSRMRYIHFDLEADRDQGIKKWHAWAKESRKELMADETVDYAALSHRPSL